MVHFSVRSLEEEKTIQYFWSLLGPGGGGLLNMSAVWTLDGMYEDFSLLLRAVVVTWEACKKSISMLRVWRFVPESMQWGDLSSDQVLANARLQQWSAWGNKGMGECVLFFCVPQTDNTKRYKDKQTDSPLFHWWPHPSPHQCWNAWWSRERPELTVKVN